MVAVNDILKMRVNKQEGIYLVNKPLVVLFALGRLKKGESRLTSFVEYEKALKSVKSAFGNVNVLYPFGRLVNDGFWEVTNFDKLYKDSSGNLIKSELVQLNIQGGFNESFFELLINDKQSIEFLINELLNRYIPKNKRDIVLSGFNLNSKVDQYCMNDKQLALDIQDAEIVSGIDNLFSIKNNLNGFVSYLNSLHNVNANGANALAESQIFSKYFFETYQPFPLVDELVNLLKNEEERVIILTGHAGDGKSTIAFDVLKQLRGLPAHQPLSAAIKDCEEIQNPATNSRVSIVKDMSELSAEQRRESINKAFTRPGSWLIVSNTGPLLDSLMDYANQQELEHGVESDILACLSQDFDGSHLEENQILEHFSKPLLILNLTRLDNVAISAKVLRRLIQHSGWNECSDCILSSVCPLLRNQQALQSSLEIVEQRVRWIYQRLNAYEQRLTLRQIVAQLAWALTGGKNCSDIYTEISRMASHSVVRSIGDILFSEGFFGYYRGKPCERASSLQAVQLTRRVAFGAPINVRFDRLLVKDAGAGWGELPNELENIITYWQKLATESGGMVWRAALRRLLYFFGKSKQNSQIQANEFLDGFLQSSSVRIFDLWTFDSGSDLDEEEQNKLRTSCLQVLLENYSGFNMNQFKGELECLYITLQRPRYGEMQLVKVVKKEIPFDNFDIRYDSSKKTLFLVYTNNKDEEALLKLSIPFLDYIRYRDNGGLGNFLTPIHQAQLDQFRENLLLLSGDHKKTKPSSSIKVTLLCAGVDGMVGVHRFHLDKKNNKIFK